MSTLFLDSVAVQRLLIIGQYFGEYMDRSEKCRVSFLTHGTLASGTWKWRYTVDGGSK